MKNTILDLNQEHRIEFKSTCQPQLYINSICMSHVFNIHIFKKSSGWLIFKI